jgi:hypothetical protein
MRDRNALLAVTDQLCGAATSSDSWSQALDAMVRAFNGDHVLLYTVSGSNPWSGEIASAGLDESDLARFASPAAAHLAAPFQRAVPIGLAVPVQDLLGEQDIRRGEFFNEIIRPTKTYYFHPRTAGTARVLEPGDLPEAARRGL